MMKSGYVKTGDPTTNSWDAYTFKNSKSTSVLDVCNGRKQPDGTYGYHATTDFPYIIGCFTGAATLPKGRAAEPMPPMGGPTMGGPPPGADGKLPPPGGPMGGPPPGADGKMPPPGGPTKP